jgi:hypothetical protein
VPFLLNSLKATSLALFNRLHSPSHHIALMAEEERGNNLTVLTSAKKLKFSKMASDQEKDSYVKI